MYSRICMAIIFIQVTAMGLPNQINEEVDGVLIKRAYINIMKAPEVMLSCPSNNVEKICSNDCQTLLTCHTGSTVPILATNCSDLSSGTPFCVPGTTDCTHIPDHNNTQCVAKQKSTFECTNTGCFPDPSDCTQYHICTSVIQETYQCPQEYVFDATDVKCKLRNILNRCFTIDCTRSLDTYVPYPGHKSYYAHCGSNDQITMYKCGDTDHFRFNRKTSDCDFVCKSSGWFPNYENCHQYYECYKIKHNYNRGRKWFKTQIHTCPDNYVYDAMHQQCVEGECGTGTTPAVTSIPTTTDQPIASPGTPF